jgi:hypothetical protein
MRNPGPTAILLLLAFLPVNARTAVAAASPPVASESRITVTGAGIAAETYDLTIMNGDWFSTLTDAHASLTLRSAPGTHHAQLSIQWDGKALTQTIHNDNNDKGGEKRFTFYLHLSGSGGDSQDAQPQGNDAVRISVTRMDDQALEVAIAGTVTGTKPLRISGAIKLHRLSAPVALISGSFGNCDPRIHDKLAGAEWRTPSECEVKFDAYVRKGLTAALEPVIDNLIAHDWSVASEVEAQPLTSIPRHTETKPFQLAEQKMHQGGAFYVSLVLDKNSPIYQRYDLPVQTAMQKFGAAMKSMNAAEMAAAQNGLRDATKAEEEHTTCTISFVINQAGAGISNFKGGHTVEMLPSGGFAVSAPFVQSPSGGDVSGAQRVTYVFLGSFTPPEAAGPGAGSETIQVKGSLNPAKLLSVQNIRIRIQGGVAQAQQVISLIDWSALEQLMAGK